MESAACSMQNCQAPLQTSWRPISMSSELQTIRDNFGIIPGAPSSRASSCGLRMFSSPTSYTARTSNASRASFAAPRPRPCSISTTGTYLIWYPLKHEVAADRFVAAVTAQSELEFLDVRLSVCAAFAGLGLTAAGVLVLNPPYVLREELEA